MEIFRQTAVATSIFFPLIDVTARPSYSSPTPGFVSGDIKIIRFYSGSWHVDNPTNAADTTGSGSKAIWLALTATEMTSANLDYPIIVQIIDQTAPKVWDDQMIVIWTKPLISNMVQINSDSVAGNVASLTLKTLDIQNSTGSAFVAKSTGSNGHGIETAGNGAGSGFKNVGGATGPGQYNLGGVTSGHAIYNYATNGNGTRNIAGGNSSGIYNAGDGNGNGQSNIAGNTGDGVKNTGGSTSGSGFVAIAPVNGYGMDLSSIGTNKHALNAHATGSAANGASFTADDGSGLGASGGGNLGHGIDARGSYSCAVAAHGINAVANSSNGSGLKCLGGVASRDIYAAEIGAPVNLGDGSSLAANMTSLAGKTASAATYNRATDSQEAIADAIGVIPTGSITDDIKDILLNKSVISRHVNQKPAQYTAGTGANIETVNTTIDVNGNVETEIQV
jgi:hypothetical protein